MKPINVSHAMNVSITIDVETVNGDHVSSEKRSIGTKSFSLKS